MEQLSPKQNIDQFIDYHNELGMFLLKIDSLTKKLPVDALAPYKQEVWNLIQELQFVRNTLKENLEDYFKLEREQNLPVQFSYRKIYKVLKELK